MSLRVTKIWTGVWLLSSASLAHAHGSGLFLIFVGLPFALLSYLVFSAMSVLSAAKGQRMYRAILCVAFAPIWGMVFWTPWLSNYEENLRPYEVEWSLILPGLLLFAGIAIVIKTRSKRNALKNS
jgi:hypothetical protein